MPYLNTNKSKEVDENTHKSLSHLSVKAFILYGETRCRICGQWITWKGVDIRTMPIHEQLKIYDANECSKESVVFRQRWGASKCQDWAETRWKHKAEKAKQLTEKRMEQSEQYEKKYKELLESGALQRFQQMMQRKRLGLG